MNIDVKNLQQPISKLNPIMCKRNYTHDQVGFLSGIQGWFYISKTISVNHHINRLQMKAHMTMLIYAEKAFDNTYS